METSLDVEMAHALAPAATIDLVVAPSNNGDALNAVEQYVVSRHLGNVVSMSFGVPEGDLHGNNAQILQAEAIANEAAAAGISLSPPPATPAPPMASRPPTPSSPPPTPT